jgi:hypothetical protein
MNEIVTLLEMDVDGALGQTAAALPTRGQFLRRGVGAAVLGGLTLGLVPTTAAAKAAKGDIAILNFALALEYLQAATPIFRAQPGERPFGRRPCQIGSASCRERA